MDRFLFFFITGAASSLFWPMLPPLYSFPVLGIVGLLCLKKHWLALLGIVTSIAWMASVGHCLLLMQPEPAIYSSPVEVSGSVLSIQTPTQNTFNFQMTRWRPKGGSRWQRETHKIRLSWRHPEFTVQQGQTLQLLVKLKPRWGLANEAGFDYQKWLFAQNIAATGYVKSSPNNRALDAAMSWRQAIINRLLTVNAPEIRWLLSLGVGYRGALSQADWQLLQASGTAHLMAISGMHLGMVALWGYCLAMLLLGVCKAFGGFSTLLNLRGAALLCALPLCFGYAQLSGLAIPTVRALLFLVLVFLLLNYGIYWRLYRLLMVSFAVFIVLFPLGLFSLSFWMSFAAVSVIAFVVWRLPSQLNSGSLGAKLGYFAVMQLCLCGLMLPLSLALFGGMSLVSPWVNLIAIPAVTFYLLPLSLCTIVSLVCCPVLSEFFMGLSVRSFRYFEDALHLLVAADWSYVRLDGVPPSPLLFACIGLLLLLLPALGVPRMLYLFWFLPLVSHLSPAGKKSWQMDVLDVGQGLAVLFRKSDAGILYDTGAAYPSGFSMAEAVIIPVLQKANLKGLDMLIISHGDNDHAGGLAILQRRVAVKQVRQSPDSCRAGERWQWKGLHFAVLWPDLQHPALLASDNNISCVVMISDGKTRVLLTGDIEKAVESELVRRHRRGDIDLRADVLVVPHHGSKTSSSIRFVYTVAPRYAIVSAGYRNRWNMPAKHIEQRYLNAGIALLNTATAGQIRLKVAESGSFKIDSWRLNQHPRWFLQPLTP